MFILSHTGIDAAQPRAGPSPPRARFGLRFHSPFTVALLSLFLSPFRVISSLVQSMASTIDLASAFIEGAPPGEVSTFCSPGIFINIRNAPPPCCLEACADRGPIYNSFPTLLLVSKPFPIPGLCPLPITSAALPE